MEKANQVLFLLIIINLNLLKVKEVRVEIKNILKNHLGVKKMILNQLKVINLKVI